MQCSFDSMRLSGCKVVFRFRRFFAEFWLFWCVSHFSVDLKHLLYNLPRTEACQPLCAHPKITEPLSVAICVTFFTNCWIVYCNSVLTRSTDPPPECSLDSRRLARWKDSPRNGWLGIFNIPFAKLNAKQRPWDVCRRAAALWDIGESLLYFSSICFLYWIDLRKWFLVAKLAMFTFNLNSGGDSFNSNLFGESVEPVRSEWYVHESDWIEQWQTAEILQIKPEMYVWHDCMRFLSTRIQIRCLK